MVLSKIKHMKKLVLLLLIIIVGIVFRSPLQSLYYQYLYYSPCDTPIKYHIGSIDSRFGLSNAEFSDDIKQATGIWSNAWGKQLFVEDQKGNLSVSLVYDQRQYLNSQISQLNNQLSNEKSSIKPEINQYNQEAQNFHSQLLSLNSQIEYWNNKGGAPSDVYQKLTQEQATLQAEATKLNLMANSLNQSTDQYNVQIGQLNQTVNQYNSALKQRPEEGLYDPQNNTITIYFNVSHQELVHTLAHEFGHSLGMVHVADPQAIMYPQTNQQIVPTNDDLAQLKYVCRKQSIIFLLRDKIQTLASTLNIK